MNNKVKAKIIELVKRTNDDNLLEKVYNILDNNINYKDSQLFEELTDYQQKDTLRSLQESDDINNLVEHEKVMAEIRSRYGWS